jgi:hypothetical protein
MRLSQADIVGAALSHMNRVHFTGAIRKSMRIHEHSRRIMQ